MVKYNGDPPPALHSKQLLDFVEH